MPEEEKKLTEIKTESKTVNKTVNKTGSGAAVPEGTTNNPHDKGYKQVLRNRRVLLHMLRKYTDFKWALDVREEDIEFVDKEFVTEHFRTYESDLICRIRRGEQEIYLFLLMELQSGMDFTMPFRLLACMVNMWEQYFRNIPEDVREKKEFRLPVVVPAVLYNGKEKWTAARRFRDYLKDGESFGEYGVDFRYALIDVRRLAQEDVLRSNSVIDNIFYLDSAKDGKDFFAAVGAMMDRVAQLPTDEKNLMEIWFAHVLEGKFSEREQTFIRECFQKGEKKMISGFEQMMNEKEENARQKGIEQGIEQGTELNIIRLVLKKMQRSCTAVQIAEALEETEKKIRLIMGIAEKYAPEYDEKKILEEVMQKDI